MKRLGIVVLAIVVMATAGVANAAIQTLSYDFTRPHGSLAAPLMSFDSDPSALVLTATAFNSHGGANVHRDARGLGVKTSRRDDSEIDGTSVNETLRLTFPTDITVLQATLTLVGHNDDARVLVDAKQIYAGHPGAATIDFTGIDEALRTGVSLDFTTLGRNDDYKVSAIRVVANTKDVVPEPASIAVWSWIGLAYAGLRVWRRRGRAGLGWEGGRRRRPWTEQNRAAIRTVIERGCTRS